MALRLGVSVGLQTAARATSPTPPWTNQIKVFARTIADTTQEFRYQNEGIKQCWDKLSSTEQMAANMVEKIVSTVRRVEQVNDKLQGERVAIIKRKRLCEEMHQITEYNKQKLNQSSQDSKWIDFHTDEMDKRVAENSDRIEAYNEEKVKYRKQLNSAMIELKNAKYRLEDADESVRYLEEFRDRMELEHVEEMRSLKAAINEAYVTRNTIMSAKPDAMKNVLQYLLPSELEYEQLVWETGDLETKCDTLKNRLQEQTKEMLHLHSKNHELSKKLHNLADKVKEAETERLPGISNINAHAKVKTPLTWLEAPKASMESVRNFLMRTYGPDAEASILHYMELKASGETRWQSQMIQKDFVEYEKTLESLVRSGRHIAIKQDAGKVLAESHALPELAPPSEDPPKQSEEQPGPSQVRSCRVSDASDEPSNVKEQDLAEPGPANLTESELRLCASMATTTSGQPSTILVDNIEGDKHKRSKSKKRRIANTIRAIFRR